MPKVTTVGKLYDWDTNPGSMTLPFEKYSIFPNNLLALGYDELMFEKPFDNTLKCPVFHSKILTVKK